MNRAGRRRDHLFSRGAYKLSQPVAALQQSLPWVNDAPTWLVRFIGAAELAGAIGLIAPAAMRVAPILTLVGFIAWGRAMEAPIERGDD